MKTTDKIKNFFRRTFGIYRHNIIMVLADSYKVSQWAQYPPNTENIFSYVESRGGRFEYSVFFGLQGFIKEYLINNPVSMKMIKEAEKYLVPHLGCDDVFNKKGWELLVKRHKGYLPLHIRALPEGSLLTVKNVLATIRVTDPDFYWLTSYIEPAIVKAIWYSTTIATSDFYVKNEIRRFMYETSDMSNQEIENDLVYKLHDFGCRGVSSNESAQIGGCAHLVNFSGTDTLSALIYAKKAYNAENVGHSIVASEHSTITSWGREHEIDAFRNMILKFPGKKFACVSDSYNIYKAIEMWGELKDLLLENGCSLVIRPDSGNPVEDIVVKCLETAEKVFGMKTNSKGYKVLPNYVRFIQGDGINDKTILRILAFMQLNKFSAENIYFGEGSGLLQEVARDDMEIAMKCSAICINGAWFDVFKDPITASNKQSKKGRVTTYYDIRKNEFYSSTIDEDFDDALQTVFYNGEIKNETSLFEIRNRLECARLNNKTFNHYGEKPC